jgi:folate-binding protein YgfZ
MLQMTSADLARLRRGATFVTSRPAVFRIEGPGAVDCIQGLLTTDVARPGPDSVVYGALLTAKGMIVSDYWVLRDHNGLTLVAPIEGHGDTLELFRRNLPPRLARMTDRTGEWAVIWGIGAGIEAVLKTADLPAPHPGRLDLLPVIPGPVQVAQPDHHAPWRAIILLPNDAVEGITARLAAAGGQAGSEADAQVARILAGFPRLGAEIGERTLPQEVRFDEIGGVSYTKGCYVGQETVARVHFRGHPNRFLRGVTWDGNRPIDLRVTLDGREVGQLSSVIQLETGGLGLGVLRREVEPGSDVTVSGRPARVTALPFLPPDQAS